MTISHVFALHIVLASLVASQMFVMSIGVPSICSIDTSAERQSLPEPHERLHRVLCAICVFATSGANATEIDAFVVPQSSSFLIKPTGFHALPYTIDIIHVAPKVL